MNTLRYNVVLAGGTLNGRSTAEVASNLARLIKRDETFAIRLLQGRSVTIRSNVEHAVAQRYADSLERIEVAVRIEPETLEIDAALAEATANSPPQLAPISGAAMHAPGAPEPPLNDGSTLLPPLDFPVSDLEPIYISSVWDSRWAFQSKVGAAVRPPRWTSNSIDHMFSKTHIFVQEHIAHPATLVDKIGGVGFSVAMLTGAVATIAVPVFGLVTAAALAATAHATSRKKKHPGYGKHNQFTKEALLSMFAMGKGMWVARNQCELRAWRIGNFLDPKHFVAIVGSFHQISGVADFAAVLDVGYLKDEYKKGLVNDTGWTISRDDKFKSLSEAWRSLPGYYEPRRRIRN